MEAVLFIGLQAAGKSSFFIERYFATHVRISLDLLRTRHRERLLLDACLSTGMPFVVDNTNPTRADRQPYVEAAKAARFTVTGCYFASKLEDCLARNAARDEAASTISRRVPDVALFSTSRRLELPSLDEGFDRLQYVSLRDGRFVVEEWRDEV